MREVFPRIVWHAFFSVSIGLVLGACVKPVDVKPFLEDEKVQNIIKGKTEVDIGFEKPKDNAPELDVKGIASSSVVVAKDGTVTVTVSPEHLGDVTITAKSAAGDVYDTIKWYYDGKPDPLAIGTTFIPGSFFNGRGSYPVTVIVSKDGVLYDTVVYINVGS